MFERLYSQIEILIKGLNKRFNFIGIVRANTTRNHFSSGESVVDKRVLLNENVHRIGFFCYNKSDNSIYISFSGDIAGAENFTNEIGAHSGWEPGPGLSAYKGEITFNPAVASDGLITVTEIVREPDRREE